MTYKHPTSEYTETVRLAWLWTLLFGVFYFAVKGVWRHALIGVLLGALTLGVSWFIYPFFARGIIHRHYLRAGWRPA